MTAGLIVALPLLAALFIGFLPNDGNRRAATAAMLATLAAGVILIAAAPAVFAGRIVAGALPWLPLPGADLGFRIDGLAWMFAALIIGIGLVIVYSAYYLGPRDPKARFFAQLMFFMASMLGVVLADNLLLLAIFWELTSIASFLLIGYWRELPEARRGARMALMITRRRPRAADGGHSPRPDRRQSQAGRHPHLRESSETIPGICPLSCWSAGGFHESRSSCFTSGCRTPWCADARVRLPAPATMVKAGVFLLARLYPALAGTDAWFYLAVPAR